jgi:hypothetical protein
VVQRYRSVADALKKVDLNAAVLAMCQQLVDAKASAERWSEDIAKGKFDHYNNMKSIE